MAKGFAGTVFLTTDDCQASYEELKAPRRRVHRGARGAPLRHRLGLPRPVRQQHPAHPGPGPRLDLSGAGGIGATASRRQPGVAVLDHLGQPAPCRRRRKRWRSVLGTRRRASW